MLDPQTKRRIDTCRDILVGKIPDPKSQVEQITIALIYKFMDDMDLESEEMGGQRKFFTGEFERYAWARLVAPGTSGQDMLNTYSEALTRMPENPGLPTLFRDIFRNAYLPYRDPETLRGFLREINGFTYDHSERLGDAFEYLLSVLGSQGDAGQFRTPRHIIDFMVEIIAPKKNEVILDPACGTAGFLISSYKHILKANTSDADDGNGNGSEESVAERAIESPLRFKGDLLAPEDRQRLATNIKGYDISPDMVRLSLVNLYLHGFANPQVEEYDTLTSEEKWNEVADVILANPPFMSPKGGIPVHRRFAIQSKRSEVLFVDYIAEHLTPQGRAAVIVPEGIIFQGQSAYCELRRMLVENYLVAVVSLPAGVFNPYSGVKTSILILDRSIARTCDRIAFFRIENDGFNLGAQRRPVKGGQLSQVQAELGAWLTAVRQGEDSTVHSTVGHAVEKSRLAETTEYNLSGERYRSRVQQSAHWPMVTLGELCDIARGASPRPIQDFMTTAPEGVNWIKIGDAPIGSKFICTTKEKISREGAKKSRYVKPGDFLLSNSMSFGRPYIMATDGCIHDGWLLLRPKNDRIDQDFMYQILGSRPIYDQFVRQATGGVVNNLNSGIVSAVAVPLPTLEVQLAIVEEIERYRKVIDGARAVYENYHPTIAIEKEWPKVTLEQVSEINPETIIPERTYPNLTINYFDISAIENHTGKVLGPTEILATDAPSRARRAIQPGDLLISTVRPNLRAFAILDAVPDRSVASTGFAVVRARRGLAMPRYLLEQIRSESGVRQLTARMERGAYPSVNQGDIASLRLPLPPLETQQAIISEIEAEQALVNANLEIIARFERKIEATIARVWGDAA